MAKAQPKREFDPTNSGTINSVKDKDKKPTKSLRGKINIAGEDYNFAGTVEDEDAKKLHISFNLTQDDQSDVFATQNFIAEGELNFNRYRNSDKAPDWRTNDAIKVKGVQYRLSCWTRESKGGKFLSVAVQSEDDYQQRIASAKGEAVAAASVTPEEAGI